MKVILRDHIDQLGERGEVVAVAPGYARNYLLPKGLAFEATPGNLLRIEQERSVWAAKETKEVGEAEALAARIASTALRIRMKAGESGTLYGSVTNGDVALLLEKKGIVVERRKIEMEPIKALGSHEIAIRLHHQVKGQVKLEVVPEGEASE